MKILFILLCVGMVSQNVMAYPPMSKEMKARGTAAVDETYIPEIREREAAIQKQEAGMKQNQEEKEATKNQKEREGEAQGAEYGPLPRPKTN
jgi:hypothetical protein